MEAGEQKKPGRDRVDRWLWATRLFKTRTQAATGCRLGQVLVDGAEVKASRNLREGDVLRVTRDDLTRTVTVLGIPATRLAAKLLGDYLRDDTTEEEIERAKSVRAQKAANRVFRMPGEGRPTKKQLREIQKYNEAERGEG